MDKQPQEQKIDTGQSDFKASDVKKSAGLSYRQINDWDSKGALPNQRQGEAGWRRFTAREVFVMAVCKALRDNFGVPIEKLGFIKSFMLQKDADHFHSALDMIRRYGFTIYLLTDLNETFIMDSDLEIKDLLEMGFFRGDSSGNFILLKMNPIVNQILAMKNIPPLKTSNVIYDSLMKFDLDRTITDGDELEVLKLIRNNSFKKVTIHMQNGKVIQADAEEDISTENRKQQQTELIELIKSKKYQTITVQVHDGKVVRMSRKNPIKFSKRQ